MYQLQVTLQDHKVPCDAFKECKGGFFGFYRCRTDTKEEITFSETAVRWMNEKFSAGSAGPVDSGPVIGGKLLYAHWDNCKAKIPTTLSISSPFSFPWPVHQSAYPCSVSVA